MKKAADRHGGCAALGVVRAAWPAAGAPHGLEGGAVEQVHTRGWQVQTHGREESAARGGARGVGRRGARRRVQARVVPWRGRRRWQEASQDVAPGAGWASDLEAAAAKGRGGRRGGSRVADSPLPKKSRGGHAPLAATRHPMRHRSSVPRTAQTAAARPPGVPPHAPCVRERARRASRIRRRRERLAEAPSHAQQSNTRLSVKPSLAPSWTLR